MGTADAPSAATALTAPQLYAARYVIARVRSEVSAELLQASLFGSRARGDARRDSDIDLLLVFRLLPPDREPYATQAERIARQEARRRGHPLTVWSVSLIDLALGNRTPMLVDALADSVPVWCRGEPLPCVPFTPRDAIGCVQALLRRTAEGSQAFIAALERGEVRAAARTLRDDLVRLCTAELLLSGVTRPRRARAIREFAALHRLPPSVSELLAWGERSFGPGGKDEEAPLPPPPHGFDQAAAVLDVVRRSVHDRLRMVRASIEHPRRAADFDVAGEWSLRSAGMQTPP